MNRAIIIVVALMVVVSALLVITLIENKDLFIPATGNPVVVVTSTPSAPTSSPAPKSEVTPQPQPTNLPVATQPAGAAKPALLVSGGIFKQMMLAVMPRAGELLKVSIRPLAPGQLPPERWQEWPIIPTVSERAKAIYQAGLKKGTDPKHFSKIGDCQVIRQYFLGLFDDDVDSRLGNSPYQNLIPTIKAFEGSWTRVSMAVRTGFNVASVLSTINSDPKLCKANETPLECEFRLWNPSIVVISMETWTADRPTNLYEGYLRQIVEFVLARGALPILATKADNLEKDHSINLSIARVAFDYDIPLWNFWRAAYALPDHGLLDDGFHLTNGTHDFGNPETMKLAWPVRNITFVQAFEKVWKAVK